MQENELLCKALTPAIDVFSMSMVNKSSGAYMKMMGESELTCTIV